VQKLFLPWICLYDITFLIHYAIWFILIHKVMMCIFITFVLISPYPFWARIKLAYNSNRRLNILRPPYTAATCRLSARHNWKKANIQAHFSKTNLIFFWIDDLFSSLRMKHGKSSPIGTHPFKSLFFLIHVSNITYIYILDVFLDLI
jgi:hypothetical protein